MTPTAMWQWTDVGATDQINPIEITAGALRCRFGHDAKAGSDALECRNAQGQRIWGYDRTTTWAGGAAMIADDKLLYVAQFDRIASGCTVVAYQLNSGAIAWHRPLIGLGPIVHSKYRNHVQLQLIGSNLRVFGWETSGRYIEDVQRSTGYVVATGLVDKNNRRIDAVVPSAAAPPTIAPTSSTQPPPPGAAQTLAFEFPSTTARFNKAVAASDGQRSCTLQLDRDSDRTKLHCTNNKQRSAWGIDLAAQVFPGGALAIHGNTVLVARFCAIASGTEIEAYDLAAGTFLWRTRLYGVGPVAHSEYFNDVELRVATVGTAAASPPRLIVSGFEAAGKYLEVLDLASGQILGNRKIPE